MNLSDAKVLRIFILGPFRSLGNSKRDFNRLTAVKKHLTEQGYDAFLSVDRDIVAKLICENYHLGRKL